MATPSASGHAPVNGIQMYYEIYGDGGTPLLLLHGGGSTIQSSFAHFIPHLQGTVIAVELQAHGRTTDRDAPESFTQDADDVAAFIQYLQLGAVHVLGFSNGGSTALQLAIRHPEKVKRVISIAGATKRAAFPHGFFEGMAQATLAHMPEPLQKAFLAVTPSQQGLQAMFEKDRDRMLHFEDWPDTLLQSIQMPVLLLVGDKDVVSVAHTQEIAQTIPHGQLAVLPGGHGVMIGEMEAPGTQHPWPAITAAIVHTFLQ
ncbi:alpha/beta hydrolase [Chitinophaga parva]|uniref:Alpha/beta hydrolase n=1 Tax=Chitinophaga parva TaxID=2169414 RepID=A0A2T7BE48_9BACT|nr:alpha/beta hydrolase [Chitinophaga parva]PUZ23363.1 alpha/beta hydrolase [Chitinophaga parva]